MQHKTSLARRTFRHTLWYVTLCLLFIASITLSTFLTSAPQTATAATSSTMNFQARLLHSSGALVPDGYYNVQFNLYNVATGGTPEWTETYTQANRVRVMNGYLTVNLGSLTAFPNTINWDQEHWLTMNIGGATNTPSPSWDGEMTPRLKLTAVPYAFTAGKLQQTTGAHQSTLSFAPQTDSRNILLPDESGTICIQGSTNCGFVAGSAANFIQNGTSPQVGNFNVTGNGAIGGALSVGGNLTFTGSNAAIINRSASANTNAILVARTSTDSQDKFRIEANGKMYWGNGTDAMDTTLYRVGINTLQTDGAFTTGGTIYAGGAGVSLTGAGGSILKTYTTSGSVTQNDVVVLVSDSGGKVATSTTPRDTRIIGVFRGNSGGPSGSVTIAGDAQVNATSGVINVGDQLVVSNEAGRVMVDNNATSGILGYAINYKASGASTVMVRLNVVNGNTNPYYRVNDYRIQNAAGNTDLLRIDGTNNRLAVGPAAIPANGVLTVGTDTTTSDGGLWFGTDTGLYRYATNTLRTTGKLVVSDQLTAGGLFNATSAIISQRATSGDRALDVQVTGEAGPRLRIWSSGGINFGDGQGTLDTNLYRSAASTLQTDSSFILNGTGANLSVGGTLSVTGAATLSGGLTVGSQFTNNASTLNTALALGNFPAGGVVGTAAATVDTKTMLTIAQTTVGQTLSLPTPTDTTAGRIMYVLNTGITGFTMHGVTIPNGYGQIYMWNGSAWVLGASGGGSAITLQSAYDGGNTLNTSDARDIAFTLSNTATDGNFLVNIASGSTGQFKIQGNGTDLMTMGATGQLALSVQGTNGGLLIGGDAKLYRHAENFLRTTGSFGAQGNVYSGHGTAYQIRLNNNGQIQFGADQDTNLYRSDANMLATDDSFSLLGTGSNLIVQGTGVSSFGGSVQGADAAANNQFVTLGQANLLYASTGGNYINNQIALQTGNVNIQSSSISSAAGIFRAAAGQLDGDVFAVQNDTGDNMFSVDAYGIFSMYTSTGVPIASFSSAASYVNSSFGIGGHPGGSTNKALQVWAWDDAQVGQIIKLNSATATGDFLQMRTSSDTVVASFSKDGNLTTNGTVTATNFSGNGSGLTNLGADKITSGKLDDARLNDTVAILNRNNQVFIGNDQTFRNGTNSTSAFRIQNSGSQTLFNADTISQRITIGAATSAARLTVSGNSAWTPRVAAEANSWQSVTYGNGMFVAVSSGGGANRVMTSTNGTSWTSQTTPAGAWRSVTYGNGMFVAVSDSINRVMTSTNGTTWTLGTAPSGTSQSVTYGNGMFVAVGTDSVMTSTNGTTWTSQTAPTGIWQSVTYGNGTFVAAASYDLMNPAGMMTSPDGITWTPQTGSLLHKPVAYVNGRFMTFNAGYVFTSTNGIDWTSSSTGLGSASDNITSITYGNGKYVAVSYSGYQSDINTRIATSSDGLNWVSQTPPQVNSWQSIAYGNGMFVAVSTDGTNRVMTSTGAYGKAMNVVGDVDISGTIRQNGHEVCTTAGNCGSSASNILQDGNSFGVAMSLGTNDDFDLQLKTNGATRLTISNTGNATFTGNINTSGTVTATNFTGNGSGLTNLNAVNLTGTIADARLSTNVALLSRNSQVFTGNNQVFRNATNSTTALRVQNAASGNVFSVDTTNTRVTIGTASAPTLAGANLVATNAEVQTTIRIGNGTNGIDISGSSGVSYRGTARKTKKTVLTPEYAGAVLDGSGVGTMTAGHDGTRRENYYKWTTTSGSWEEYDIVITMPVPSDWDAWATSNALSVNTYTNGAVNAGSDISVIGTAGVTDVNLGAATPTSGWSTYNFNLTNARYTADGMMTIKVRVGAQSGGVVQVGNISLTYLSKF